MAEKLIRRLIIDLNDDGVGGCGTLRVTELDAATLKTMDTSISMGYGKMEARFGAIRKMALGELRFG